MAKKNKKDRPKRVNIPFDQLIYDLDYMSNENAGIIFKMIVWYSASTDDSKERINDMQKYIDGLPDNNWLSSIYKRLFACIDQDFSKYTEKCEKQRERIQKYWDARKAEEENGIPRNDMEYHGIPKHSTIYQNIPQYTNNNSNNNNNSKSSNEDNEEEKEKEENSSSSSPQRMCAHEESQGSLVESTLLDWKANDIVDKQHIPPLTSIWIEEVQMLVFRHMKLPLSENEVKEQYEDFKAQEAIETLQTTYGDWRKHFSNYVRKSIKIKNDERDIKAAQDYNSAEARAKRQEGYARVMQELLDEGKQPKKNVPRLF